MSEDNLDAVTEQNTNSTIDNNRSNNIPESYKPMGVFNYIGTLILFTIPILGLFLALTWSLAPVNKNRKNLARAILILKILCILFFILFFFYIIPTFVTPFIESLYSEFLNAFSISNPSGFMQSFENMNDINIMTELDTLGFNTINLNDFNL